MRRVLYPKVYHTDIAVVGAGPAGISAALSAARQGKKVVLITDRSILGGSCSSEIRVGPGGADYCCFNRYAKETGIMEEISNHIAYRAANAGKWRWFYFDQIYFDLVYSEPNITAIFNTYISDAETKDGRIVSLSGNCSRSETRITVEAELFIDCSGDGTPAYLSGCDFRVGAEARSEFNERFAPEKADKGTMGATLLFTSVDAGHKTIFKAPDWAIRVEDLPSAKRISKSIGRMPDGSYYGFWWVEYGGRLDMIRDDQEITEHLRKLVYGIWDYIKNSGRYPESDSQEMNWIGYLPGKRESRRIMGEYLINSEELFTQKSFPDAIGYTGWPVDVHEPENYLSPGDGYTHHWLDGIADVPLRILIAKGIDNLLLAGRNISATRQALGSLRLISTTAVMGQAAGAAAVMALEKNVLPREIPEKHIAELQEILLSQDQSITDRKLLLKCDAAKRAAVTVSSANSGNADKPETYRFAVNNLGLILPCESMKSLKLYLGCQCPTTAEIEIYASDARPENYRFGERYLSTSFAVAKSGWYEIKTDIKGAPGGKIFAVIGKNPDLKVYMQKKRFCGVVSFESGADRFTRETQFAVINHEDNNPFTICYVTDAAGSYYGKESLLNGHIRPYGAPHMWMSAARGDRRECVCYDFGKTIRIREVDFVFNSDLNAKRLKSVIHCVNPEMIKSFTIYGIKNGRKALLKSVADNFRRFVRVDAAGAEADGVLIEFTETWGSDTVEVFDIRILEE
jgi:hypothetical protein